MAPNIIGIKEVMQLLGVGRPTAERYLNKYLGKARKKGQTYRVNKENFIMWVEEGGLK